MVPNITSLTGNGLKDWLTQRATAVYFLFYCLFLLSFIFSHPQLSYLQWHDLFASGVFKIASTIAVLAFTLHTWIGIWTVTTDYIRCTIIRVSLQLLVMLILLAQLIWGFLIVWGY